MYFLNFLLFRFLLATISSLPSTPLSSLTGPLFMFPRGSGPLWNFQLTSESMPLRRVR